jgi:hypothetical protein
MRSAPETTEALMFVIAALLMSVAALLEFEVPEEQRSCR